MLGKDNESHMVCDDIVLYYVGLILRVRPKSRADSQIGGRFHIGGEFRQEHPTTRAKFTVNRKRPFRSVNLRGTRFDSMNVRFEQLMTNTQQVFRQML